MLKYDIFCGFENRNALLFKKRGNSMTYNKESFLQGMFKTIILKHMIKFTFFSFIKSIIP
jgi:hypothetical protein